MNTTLSSAAAYVDAVRTALADLPADDLTEIVEDVRDHVEQVSAELGDDATSPALEQRLGTPDDYAAELRSAAGYPPALGDETAPGRPTRSVRWLATWSLRIAVVLTAAVLLELFFIGRSLAFLGLAILAWLVAAFFVLAWWAARRTLTPESSARQLPDLRWLRDRLARWQRHPFGAAAVETALALRPAWWVLRAWVAIELIGVVFGTGLFPLPHFAGAPLLLIAAIIGSVWLGRRAASHRQSSAESALVLVGNVGAALVLLWMSTATVLSQPDEVFGPSEESRFIEPSAFRDDGTIVTNLYPYGPDGRLLENVRLYDQDGQPFSSLPYDGCLYDEVTGEPLLAAPNVFPRSTSSYGGPSEQQCQDLGIVPPLGSTLPGSPADASPAPTPSSPPSAVPTPGS